MDFRLGFGGSFGDDTELIVIGSAQPEREHPRPVAAELYGNVAGSLDALRSAGGPDRSAWVNDLRAAENEKRAAEQEATFFGQVAMPMMNARDSGAAARTAEALADLARLGAALRLSMLRVGLGPAPRA